MCFNIGHGLAAWATVKWAPTTDPPSTSRMKRPTRVCSRCCGCTARIIRWPKWAQWTSLCSLSTTKEVCLSYSPNLCLRLLIFNHLLTIERELRTPPLSGLILPGITRDSILQLTRQWGKFKVTEESFTMPDVAKLVREERVRHIKTKHKVFP